MSYIVHLRTPHTEQRRFIDSQAKRKIIRAGRRGGKTVGNSIYAVRCFLAGRRVLYATPTADQIDRFWFEATQALREPIDAGVMYVNQTRHIIEIPKTETRIRAKTAWNADTLRGDYADELLLDEFQLMDEDAWGLVGAPMLADNNGNATFIYTPPSLRSRSTSKARDPQHAAKMFKRALADTTGRWATFHFTSYDNPFISRQAVDDLADDMSSIAYRMEIMAEDVDEAPGALWKRASLDEQRVSKAPDLVRIVVSVDPEAASDPDSAETGIIAAGLDANGHAYVLQDASVQGVPAVWGQAAVDCYHRWQADCLTGEVNNGGEMVGFVILTMDSSVNYKAVHASRGKYTRAEPISALYERKRVHHVGTFPALEDQMCIWTPGEKSPDRMDALVWALTELFYEPDDDQADTVVYDERVNISEY